MMGKKYELEYRREILLSKYKYENDIEKKKILRKVIESIDVAINEVSKSYTYIKQ